MRILLLLFVLTIEAIASAEIVADAQRLLQQQLYQPAIDVLEKEIASGSTDKDVVITYARALYGAKRWEKSIPWFERAIVANQENDVAWRFLKAKALSFLGRYREALAEFSIIEVKTKVSEKVLWEHLMVAFAADDRDEVYIVAGKLAERVRDKDTPDDVRSKIKKQLDLYEAFSAEGRGVAKESALRIIEEWKKR